MVSLFSTRTYDTRKSKRYATLHLYVILLSGSFGAIEDGCKRTLKCLRMRLVKTFFESSHIQLVICAGSYSGLSRSIAPTACFLSLSQVSNPSKINFMVFIQGTLLSTLQPNPLELTLCASRVSSCRYPPRHQGRRKASTRILWTGRLVQSWRSLYKPRLVFRRCFWFPRV